MALSLCLGFLSHANFGSAASRSRGCFWVWRSRPPRYAGTRPPHTILSMGRVFRPARLAFLLAAVALAAIAPVHIAAATGTARLSAARSAVPAGAVAGELNGVAAASAKDAWAVGYTGDSAATDRTLILHWNGRRWSLATSFTPVHGTLMAVTAVSADDAWAVGDFTNAAGSDPKALVVHWNGKVWRRQGGAPPAAGSLLAVAATKNAVWAVGASAGAPALTERLVGGHWYLVPIAAFQLASLNAVVITGGTVWAAGWTFYSNSYHGLLVRWNGTMWKAVGSPLQGPGNILYAIGARRAGALWAVGDYWNSVTAKLHGTSMLRNSTTWRNVLVPVPPSPDQELSGVAFIPGGTAWAVGKESGRSVILHWAGTAWSRSGSPNLGSGGTVLAAVAATSARDAWTVGFSWFDSNEPPVIAILHWNGRTWASGD